jgi:hypothetical protein
LREKICSRRSTVFRAYPNRLPPVHFPAVAPARNAVQ